MKQAHSTFILLLLLASTSALLVADSASFPEVIPLPDGFGPEGIATGRGTDFYVGAIWSGAVYKGDLRTGAGELLVPPRPGERFAVGMDVDRRTNYLFVAGGFAPVGYVYNAATGDDAGIFPLGAPGGLINDVVVTREAAYFTDSFQPLLYRLPLGPGGSLPAPDAAEAMMLGGDFVNVPGAVNANGIDATPDAGWLVLVNLELGTTYRVDPWSGYASQIDLGGASLPGADGILLDPRDDGTYTLYVVQNALNQIAVVHLEADLLSGVVVGTIVSPDFRVPTTVAEFGNTLYAVNARFDVAPPPLPPPSDLEFEVVAVAKE
jgi:hypothetical protein